MTGRWPSRCEPSSDASCFLPLLTERSRTPKTRPRSRMRTCGSAESVEAALGEVGAGFGMREVDSHGGGPHRRNGVPSVRARRRGARRAQRGRRPGGRPSGGVFRHRRGLFPPDARREHDDDLRKGGAGVPACWHVSCGRRAHGNGLLRSAKPSSPLLLGGLLGPPLAGSASGVPETLWSRAHLRIARRSRRAAECPSMIC